MSSVSLSIIVPAFNEEGSIAKVIGDLAAAFPDAEIVVVDDGSSDGTYERATAAAQRHPGVAVYQHGFNRGYGSALRTGSSVATGELVAWFDADGEHSTDDLAAMVDYIRNHRVAAVIGERRASVTRTRGVGKFVLRLIAWIFGLRGVRDLNCGLRVFRQDVIRSFLSFLPPRYSASLTTTIMLRFLRMPLASHRIVVHERVGESKVKLKDGLRALQRILFLAVLLRPLRVFMSVGAPLVIAGLAYGLSEAIANRRGFPVAGLLLTLVGVQTCMMGLLVEQIANLRLRDYFHEPTIARRATERQKDSV